MLFILFYIALTLLGNIFISFTFGCPFHRTHHYTIQQYAVTPPNMLGDHATSSAKPTPLPFSQHNDRFLDMLKNHYDRSYLQCSDGIWRAFVLDKDFARDKAVFESSPNILVSKSMDSDGRDTLVK